MKKKTYIIPLITTVIGFTVPAAAMAYLQPIYPFFSMVVIVGAIAVATAINKEILQLDKYYEQK